MVVRRAPDGEIADVTPAGVSARTLVHEYGGGMYAAFRGEDGGEGVIFSDQADQRLYRQDLRPAGEARAGLLERPTPDHARFARRARPPLRRRARHAGRPSAGERPRAARGRRRGGQRPGEPAHRRVGRASHRRLRTRLLRRAAHQPGRAPSRLALVGPPAHAVGRHGAVDGGARRRRQRHRRAARRRRRGRGHPAAAVEPGRHALVRERPHRLVEPVRGRAGPGERRPARPSPARSSRAPPSSRACPGSSACRATCSSTAAVCSRPTPRTAGTTSRCSTRRQAARTRRHPAAKRPPRPGWPRRPPPGHPTRRSPRASSTRRTPSSSRSRRWADAPG